ncbi:MAG TPA: crossover junction endodeoxyribonuclease RuvC [Gammaproteobacteria bacterium]|nr:crossover junction endodeoxyribonuclease RuvC [Gammaproteobacteria bacterium]
MTIIIGIDPGSRFTGYGVIQWENNQSRYLDSGCLAVTSSTISERLQKIFTGIQAIVQLHQPHEAAIEQVFMHQNPGAALKLGQARGAALVALGTHVAEYSARQVKQSVVGYGAADKKQVQHMVKKLLNVSMTLQADAADALAVALCHAHTRFCLLRTGLPITSKKRASGWRHYQPD